MNIAIITFSDFNTNYGSILQAFALKTFLESEGHSVTFIKYREFNSSSTKFSINQIRSILIKAYYWIYRSEKKRRTYNFKQFIDEYLKHTRLYTSEEDLEQNLESFDAYICGSDQIWNIECLGGFREPYFLKFADSSKLKIAYAPSMGDYIPTADITYKISCLLKSFNAISTREKRSSQLVSEIFGKTVPTVVDPTLLLNRSQWIETVGSNKPSIDGEYAVCYFVRRHPLAEKMVSYFKKKYSIPIYNLSDNHIHVRGTKNDYITSSPSDFVNLIANAKFCIGTSFHLAAFSTIFDKHCYIIKTGHNESRIKEIFTLVGRVDHMTSGDFDKLPDTKSMIDYTKYDTHVNMSKDFLRSSLSVV